MAKKTIKQLNAARVVIDKYLTRDEKGQFDKNKSKINYAVFKFDSKTSIRDIISEQIEDINIEYCSTDDKGNIIHDDKGNKVFNKENLRLRLKALKELDAKEVDFEPYFISKENYENVITDEDDLQDLKGIFIE